MLKNKAQIASRASPGPRPYKGFRASRSRCSCAVWAHNLLRPPPPPLPKENPGSAPGECHSITITNIITTTTTSTTTTTTTTTTIPLQHHARHPPTGSPPPPPPHHTTTTLPLLYHYYHRRTRRGAGAATHPTPPPPLGFLSGHFRANTKLFGQGHLIFGQALVKKYSGKRPQLPERSWSRTPIITTRNIHVSPSPTKYQQSRAMHKCIHVSHLSSTLFPELIIRRHRLTGVHSCPSHVFVIREVVFDIRYDSGPSYTLLKPKRH